MAGEGYISSRNAALNPPSTSNNSASWATIIQGLGEGLKGGINATAESGKSKLTKKEAKRRTLADMLNKALTRQFDIDHFMTNQGGEMAFNRASALRNTANEFTKSLM